VLRVSFLSNAFVNNMGSSVLSGPLFRHRFYSGIGLGVLDAVQMVAFVNITALLGILTVGGSCLLLAPLYIDSAANSHTALTLLLGSGCLILALIYLGRCALKSRPLVWQNWQVRFPSLETGLLQLLLASLNWLLAAGVLYTLLSPFQMPFLLFCGIFIGARVVGLISQMPAGLGIFEAVMLVALAPWIPSGECLAALLIFRGLYYLLPLVLCGSFLLRHAAFKTAKAITKVSGDIVSMSTQVMPQYMAIMTFIAGAILLFSGALPTVPDRVDFIKAFIPLSTIEFSHFLGSVTGLFLILVSRAVQKRLNLAYYICLGLFLFGAVFSLIKGFGYEEAAILIVMFCVFLPCKKLFWRKSLLTEEFLSAGWLLATFLAVLCSLWLGLFTFKHLEYKDQLWWTFSLHSDAPRFMRASVSIITICAFLTLLKLISSSKRLPVSNVHDLNAISLLITHARNPTANLALLGDKQLILSSNQKAFLMYGIKGRTCVALGDPVGPEEEWDELTDTLIKRCKEKNLRPAFYQVAAQHTHHYIDQGFYLFKLGEEANVDTRTFTLQGSRFSDQRQACNRAEKKGFTFAVVPREQTPAILPRLREISDAWLEEKHTKEKGFSLGFFDENYIRRFPIAVVRNADKIVAFANIFATESKDQFTVDLMRSIKDEAPSGVMDYLFCKLILWGKEQGYDYFSLGMAPLSGLNDSTYSSVWNKLGNFIFQHGEHFYNFEGLREYKDKYAPTWTSRYLACRNPLLIPTVLADIAALSSGGLKGVFLK